MYYPFVVMNNKICLFRLTHKFVYATLMFRTLNIFKFTRTSLITGATFY